MRRLAILALLATFAGAPSFAGAQSAPPLGTPALEAHLEVPVATAEVGEPLTMTLIAAKALPPISPEDDALGIEREARRELRQHFGKEPFAKGQLDYSWELLDAGPVVIQRSSEAEQGGMLTATQELKLVSLEAGKRSLPLPAFEGELAPVDVEFTSLLAEGEDQPRPLLSFREVPPEEVAKERPLWPVAALGGALLALLAWVLVKRRSRRTRLVAGDPRKAIEGLIERVRQAGGTQDELHAAHFHLTRLVRAALDRGPQGTSPLRGPRGLTDEEWLSLRLPRLGISDAEGERLQQFFEACGKVKYGGEAVTEWGLKERVESALELTHSGGHA